MTSAGSGTQLFALTAPIRVHHLANMDVIFIARVGQIHSRL